MECKPGSQQKAAEHTYLYRAKFAKVSVAFGFMQASWRHDLSTRL